MKYIENKVWIDNNANKIFLSFPGWAVDCVDLREVCVADDSVLCIDDCQLHGPEPPQTAPQETVSYCDQSGHRLKHSESITDDQLGGGIL